jgi:endonuclease/exonuclease/phosphatase family metal-dependent hydrolase
VKKFAHHAAAPALAVAVCLAPASAGAAPATAQDIPSPLPRADGASAPRNVSFNVATFNVYGGSHTNGRGGMRSGTARMKGAVRYLRKHKVSLAGLQELEPKQAAAFRKRTQGKWGLVGAPSRSGKSTDTRNSVAYYKPRFSVVKKTYVPITYFHGNRVNIPLVQLRSKSNGKVFWVLNTHNPADVHGSAARWRAESVRRELKRIKRLRSQGATVLFTGDMNAKREFFCRATRTGMLHSASGGSVGKPCRYPRENGIDWVLGTRDVRFRKWRSDKTTRASGVSDHPIVVARATLRP